MGGHKKLYNQKEHDTYLYVQYLIQMLRYIKNQGHVQHISIIHKSQIKQERGTVRLINNSRTSYDIS